MSPPYRLYSAKGGGSMIVEVAFTLAGLPFECHDVEWAQVGPESAVLAPLNPLGQIPTVVLPDGSVLTESAAIVLHAAEHAPAAELAPRPGDPRRAAFLRWLVFLNAAVYPTFTYGDDPLRWVEGDEPSAARLRRSTDAHREKLLTWLDREVVREPWFLGERFSALDVYLWTISLWRPGRAWFAEHAPRLHAIALAAEALPAVAAVHARNRS
ncbi:MAG: glutathione S-transferase [Deltaproteobacteria bacterium]|nr:glutathione S-transferase [Deltaproteobacteria bacterium]